MAKNFRDPAGLLRRMLFSGNRVARFVLFREFFNLASKPVDWLLQPLEKRLFKAVSSSDTTPKVFVVGGSRSGTTLVYQTLAHYLPVSYFSNLSAAFPRSPIFATWLFSRFFRRFRGESANFFGSVRGINAPNDGFPILNRWFGEDRNRVDVAFGEESKQDLVRFFSAWHKKHPNPFLNKNNRNSILVRELAESLDAAYFLEVRRDPVFVVQSLLNARKEVQGDSAYAWGLLSEDAGSERDRRGQIESVCRQVEAVELELAQARSLVRSDRYWIVQYEEFCEDPKAVVRELGQELFQDGQWVDSLSEMDSFQCTNRRILPNEEFEFVVEYFESRGLRATVNDR